MENTKVYIVRHYDIYDAERTEFIFGVASSYDKAVEMIKDEIKNVAASYHCSRYSIEEWEMDKRDMGGSIKHFTKQENIEFAKELGVYQED